MIPKIIHYCWFGGNPLPEDAKKCINSWKKYFPDYEIKEWNESNYDFNKCEYIKEAYKRKKWAFVSDYARFDILYQYGGIYFDTDVEVIRDMRDILKLGPYMGLEKGSFKNVDYVKINCNPMDSIQDNRVPSDGDINFEKGKIIAIATGLGLAANPRMSIFKVILDEYQKRHFIKDNGENDLFTVVYFITNIILNSGIKVKNGLGYSNGLIIYPKDYFCPKDYETGYLNITDNTRTIHHYSATWITETQQRIHDVEQMMISKYGEKKGRKIAKKKTLFLRLKNSFETRNVLEKFARQK